MAELPRGTVTFVFTDIEGSTRLLASLGSRYEAVLANHRQLLRDAFRSHGGVEVDTQGDALFYAFAKAHEAVSAAIGAQRTLSSHDFGQDVELRVRMGIHTGEPTVTEEGYVGSDLHLGARICAAAWGGQILLSPTTAAHVFTSSDDISVRPLGAHALKDIHERVELSQVIASGLRADFPSPRTTGSHPTNLPARLEPLIGRDQELSTFTELLATDGVFLVTLTGPGGTGKTRLALATGQALLDSFADGVFFIDLSSTTDPDLVVSHIAHALSLRETPGRSLKDTLTGHLASKQMLLVLDNLEQVIDAAPDIATLLAGAPWLKVLATSREPLRVAAERVYSLPPLEVPAADDHDPQELERYAAVALFLERARAVKKDFALTADNAAEVAAICRRLDGLPLALELAAARTNLLSPAALLSRLDHGLKLLTSGRRDAAQRQRTLKGAISWSYELLSKDEQTIFCRLGVFAGGWSLEAAERVCDRGDLTTEVLDGLSSLVDKSLVRAAGGQERFSMLETIREFSLEKLEQSEETEEIWRAHAEFFRQLAEEAESHLIGSDQKQWLDRLEAEHDNFRAALDWSVKRTPALALHIAGLLWRFWYIRGYFSEGGQRLKTALSPDQLGSSLDAAKALRGVSVIAGTQGTMAEARTAAEESLRLYRAAGDHAGTAGCLSELGGIALEEGKLDEATNHLEEAADIDRRAGDSRGLGVILNNLADVAWREGRMRAARDLLSQALGLSRQANDQEGISLASINLGFIELLDDRVEHARLRVREGLSIAAGLNHQEAISYGLEATANLAARNGMYQVAAELSGAADEMRKRSGLSLGTNESKLHTEREIALRTALGMERYSAAIEKGEGRDSEATIRLGLHALDECRAIVSERDTGG